MPGRLSVVWSLQKGGVDNLGANGRGCLGSKTAGLTLARVMCCRLEVAPRSCGVGEKKRHTVPRTWLKPKGDSQQPRLILSLI